MPFSRAIRTLVLLVGFGMGLLVACDGGGGSDVGTSDATSDLEAGDTTSDGRTDGDDTTRPGDTAGRDTDAGGESDGWTRLLGGSKGDRAQDSATDGSGNLYVVGTAGSDIDDGTVRGPFDAYVAKYTPDGDRRWVEFLRSSRGEVAHAVAVGSSGHLYVAGETNGPSLGGDANNGMTDAFVAQYTTDGRRNWTEVFGTSTDDSAFGVSLHGSGAVVVGEASGAIGGANYSGAADAFVAKFDSTGSRAWVRLFGKSGGDEAHGVTTDDSEDIYVAGVEGDPSDDGGGIDIGESGSLTGILAKYDGSGTRLWSADNLSDQSKSNAYDVSVDGPDHVYVTGQLSGDQANGAFDSFVARYDTDGNRKWSQSIATPGADQAWDLSVGGSGGVFVVGKTNGTFDGTTPTLDSDAFLVGYDRTGRRTSSRRLGTPAYDQASGVSTPDSDRLYVVGATEGDLHGRTNNGRSDAFVTSLPQP